MKRSCGCCLVPVILVVLAVVFWPQIGPHVKLRQTITVSPADIQRVLARGFPQEKRELIVTARFSDPTVSVAPGADRLQIGITTTVEAPGIKPVSGKAVVDGRVRYAEESGELFLEDPKIQRTEIKGLPDWAQKPAERLAGEALTKYVTRVPLYKLNEADPTQSLAKRVIKSVTVRNGQVLVDVGT